ncbi:hypothetical protein [Streptomyces europaeiscabiei]|uniref:hypothetical protein n=1 Tax=Streptomyces europaeiscabiei TaxID=146819 RepID=UPI002E14448E|nr:hypothetical protein OHB30_47995 [Streptomyces europaeiscabiei]
MGGLLGAAQERAQPGRARTAGHEVVNSGRLDAQRRTIARYVLPRLLLAEQRRRAARRPASMAAVPADLR